jgi:hypothetical protein
MSDLSSLDIFDTPVTDLSPLKDAKNLAIEMGGKSVAKLRAIDDWGSLKIYLIRYVDDEIPAALQEEMQRVQISLIFERYGAK